MAHQRPTPDPSGILLGSIPGRSCVNLGWACRSRLAPGCGVSLSGADGRFSTGSEPWARTSQGWGWRPRRQGCACSGRPTRGKRRHSRRPPRNEGRPACAPPQAHVATHYTVAASQVARQRWQVTLVGVVGWRWGVGCGCVCSRWVEGRAMAFPTSVHAAPRITASLPDQQTHRGLHKESEQRNEEKQRNRTPLLQVPQTANRMAGRGVETPFPRASGPNRGVSFPSGRSVKDVAHERDAKNPLLWTRSAVPWATACEG